MKCLGIAIKKNQLWYSVVSGDKMSSSIIIETGKQNFRADSSTQSLMMDFNNIFTELLMKYKPDSVAYKMSLNVDKKQTPYMHYSLGILNLVCNQKNVDAVERTNAWITAGKKSKIAKFEEYFYDRKFTKEEMEASLVAWYNIGE